MASKVQRAAMKPPIETRAIAQGSLRGDLKRYTRERLLAAALEAFTQQGYRGTSVERIVELAGTTTPTFYRHFSSKIELLPDLSHHLSDEVARVLLKLDAMGEPSRADVREWLGVFIEMWERMHWLCNAFWEATEQNELTASTVMPETMKAAAIMQRLMARHTVDKAERLKVRLAMLVVTLDRIVAIHRSTEQKALADMMLDEFASMFWLSIYGDNEQ